MTSMRLTANQSLTDDGNVAITIKWNNDDSSSGPSPIRLKLSSMTFDGNRALGQVTSIVVNTLANAVIGQGPNTIRPHSLVSFAISAMRVTISWQSTWVTINGIVMTNKAPEEIIDLIKSALNQTFPPRIGDQLDFSPSDRIDPDEPLGTPTRLPGSGLADSLSSTHVHNDMRNHLDTGSNPLE